MESEDELIIIHIDNKEGKTIDKIEVMLSELVELYMNTYFPIKEHKNLN